MLDAAHALFGTTRPVDLAYADVARRARVSVRTLYRHFPTPDRLFIALSDRLLGAIMGSDTLPSTDLVGVLRMMSRQFEMLER
jgi:AcrR family transcriptional regulator